MTKKYSPFSTYGKIIVSTGMFRIYENGNTYGLLIRWWHPLAWLYAPIITIIAIAVLGIPETWREMHSLGLTMNPWFVRNPERLKWVTIREALG